MCCTLMLAATKTRYTEVIYLQCDLAFIRILVNVTSSDVVIPITRACMEEQCRIGNGSWIFTTSKRVVPRYTR